MAMTLVTTNIEAGTIDTLRNYDYDYHIFKNSDDGYVENVNWLNEEAKTNSGTIFYEEDLTLNSNNSMTFESDDSMRANDVWFM